MNPPLPRLSLHLAALLACAALLVGCAEVPKDVPTLRLATTTSLRDSGLLDELLPVFEKQRDCKVQAVAVGTGAALKLGAGREADLLIVHAPDAEAEFMDAGHGLSRREFMSNAFVLVGPKDDPARIKDVEPSEALKQIRKAKARFVSRGDDSGTHKRELALWKAAGGLTVWEEYLESGQGMGATLTIADEKQAYTLTDSGTWLNFQSKLDLVAFSPPSESLHNPYSVIIIRGAARPELAEEFADFLLSEKAQRIIRDYRIGGEQAFEPHAGGDRVPEGT